MRAPTREVLQDFAHRGATSGLATQMLSVACALLIAAGVMFGVNLVSLRHDFDSDRASSRVVEKLDDVEKYLMGVDLTVRGYALSGNDVFLSYRQLEMQKLSTAFAALPPLVAAVPEQAKGMERLRKAMQVRVDALSGLMRMAHRDRPALGRAILDPDVRSTMREARAAISAVRTMEMVHRDQMATEALERASRNTLLAGAILALAFVFGVFGLSFALFARRDQ